MSRGNTRSDGVRVMIRRSQHHYIRGIHHCYLTFLLVAILCVDYTKSDPAPPHIIRTVNTDASLHPIATECSKPKDGQVGKSEEFVAGVTGMGQENYSEYLHAKAGNKNDEQLNQGSNARHDKKPKHLSTNTIQESEDATDTQLAQKSTEHPFHHDNSPTLLPPETETSANPQIIETLEERREREVSRNFSSLSFSSLESALLSLAFLTFAVFLVGLVQDLFTGNSSTTTSGRKRQTTASGLLKLLSGDNDDHDDRMADLIVLTLSSIDTLSYGRENPDCGRKLLCHLNRSGWHDGILGAASNYFVSLVFSLVSPSGFQDNLDAAKFGRERQDCTSRYASCPSVIGELLPTL